MSRNKQRQRFRLVCRNCGRRVAVTAYHGRQICLRDNFRPCLEFETEAEAKAFARRHRISARIEPVHAEAWLAGFNK